MLLDCIGVLVSNLLLAGTEPGETEGRLSAAIDALVTVARERDLLLIAVDNGKDKMVYAGPVLSYYEFEMSGVNRKSDSEWKRDLQEGRAPAPPEWTRTYLVPGRKQEKEAESERD